MSYERIRDAVREPENWLTYSGSYAGWRYSKLDRINPNNASRLNLQWAFQVGDLESFGPWVYKSTPRSTTKVLDAGQRKVDVVGPLLEDEAAEIQRGFWADRAG